MHTVQGCEEGAGAALSALAQSYWRSDLALRPVFGPRTPKRTTQDCSYQVWPSLHNLLNRTWRNLLVWRTSPRSYWSYLEQTIAAFEEVAEAEEVLVAVLALLLVGKLDQVDYRVEHSVVGCQGTVDHSSGS